MAIHAHFSGGDLGFLCPSWASPRLPEAQEKSEVMEHCGLCRIGESIYAISPFPPSEGS